MIVPHVAYNNKDFKLDIIEMMKIAGIKGKGLCFLFPDNHV